MSNIIAFSPPRSSQARKVFGTASAFRLVTARVVLTTTLVALIIACADFVSRLLAMPDAGPPVALAPQDYDPTYDETLYSLQDAPVSTCSGVPVAEGAVAAFIPADDPTARSALLARCENVGRVFAESLTFGVDAGAVIPLSSDGWVDGIVGLGRPVFIMLSAQFDSPDGSKRALLPTDAARHNLAASLPAFWSTGTGLCLDLSGDSSVSAEAVLPVLRMLRDLAAARSAPLCLAAGLDAVVLKDDRVTSLVDAVVAKAFQEPGRLPLPLAPQPWFEASIAPVVGDVPAEKLTVALGTFGIQTDSATGFSEQIAYGTAMARAHTLGGTARTDPEALNTEINFKGPAKSGMRIRMLDGMSFANEFSWLPSSTRLALWPFGYEDPAVWSILAGAGATAALTQPIRLDRQVLLSGMGPVALRAEDATNGLRKISIDPETRHVVGMSYSIWPSPQILTRIDGGVDDAVLIAFDGIPPPEVLSEVLGQLARNGVNAVFSVTAKEIVLNRDTVRRIIAAGHAIAHAETGELSGSGILTMIARLNDRIGAMALAGETGWRSILAETAGEGQSLPTSWDEFTTLIALQDQGRIRLPTGEMVPQDPKEVPAFAERVVSTVFLQGSQLVRFDLSKSAVRSTVATLPVALAEFEAAGARFIVPDDLARPAGGVALYRAPTLASLKDRFYISTLLKADSLLAGLFLVLLAFAIVRSTAFLVLAHVRRPNTTVTPGWAPPVTVVVPAYNEEKVIATCLQSIFANDYPDLRVIVVDDGSADATSARVTELAQAESRLKLVQQPNAGKWAATNTALRHLETEFFVILDADSMLAPDAVKWIVQPFVSEEVGAVSGIVEVGNSHNWLTACQNLEYRVSQNIHRRAYELFDGILVVPGAIGAWRKKAVIKAGLFSGETITEDADLTVAVHRAGYRVVMAEKALALTEAPEKLRPFMSQRLRWTLGMLQVSWKHRGAIVEGRTVGYVSILDAIWFSILTTVLSPLVDMIMLIVLGIIASRALLGQPILTDGFLVFLVGYLGLTLIDVLNTLATFRFERRFSLGLLLLTPVLRIGYRQLLYISTLRAAWRAITGRLTDWNKLDRTGNVDGRALLSGGLGGIERTGQT